MAAARARFDSIGSRRGSHLRHPIATRGDVEAFKEAFDRLSYRDNAGTRALRAIVAEVGPEVYQRVGWELRPGDGLSTFLDKLEADTGRSLAGVREEYVNRPAQDVDFP